MASNHKVDITVGVRDLASRALGNIQRQVSGMSRTVNSSGSNFGAFSRGLDGSIRKLDALSSSMYRFNMHTSNLQRNLKNVAALSSLAIGGIGIDSANKAMDFSFNMAKAQARMEVGPGVRKDIEKYILEELNREVMFNPVDISKMAITLGQSGINTGSDMKSMLKTTSYFAEAVDAVPDEAAQMIVSAAKGFGISMQDSGSITDKLTVAVNKSLLSVEELPHALGQLSGRAKMYGQSLDSSLTVLMTAKDQGMAAAQASQNFLNGLRSVSRIGNELAITPKVASYYKELGIDDSFFDKEKMTLKEFPEIIASLEKSMINNGFINPKYKKQVKNHDDYQNLIKEGGGTAPGDFWNAKEAMPLISRVFGASGMTPLMMGLQSQYEEVDSDSGEKTGKVYYGAAALKRRQEDLENSDGAVDKAHGIMEGEAKFQMGVLGGAWQATQIKFMENMLPAIKGTSEILTDYLMGSKEKGPTHSTTGPMPLDYKPLSGLDKFQNVYGEVEKNFREAGNTMTADIVKGIGDGLVAGIKIGSIAGPLGTQIAEAFGGLFSADWGDSLLTLPWHVIENGVNFITDVGKANVSLSDAISTLPENLQEPAELVTKMAQGGLILLATGAIVGVVRLAVQGLSAALKVAGLGLNLAKTIAGWVTGSIAAGTPGKGGIPDVTKTINANVVNVYGKTVTGGAGGKTPPVVAGAGGKVASDAAAKAAAAAAVAAGGGHVLLGSDGKPLKPSTAPKPIPTPKTPLPSPMPVLTAVTVTPIVNDISSSIMKKADEALGLDPSLTPALNSSTIDITKTIASDWIGLSKNIGGLIFKKVEEMEIGSEANKKLNDKIKNELKPKHFPNTEIKAASEKTNPIILPNYLTGNKNAPTSGSSYGKTEPKISPIIKVTPVIEMPKTVVPKAISQGPRIDTDTLKLISMLPREEGEQLRKASLDGIANINSAITSGFNSANEKLQNVKVDNALNINFNPTISISGDLKGQFNPTVSYSSNKATFNQPSAKQSASSRGNEIQYKRTGPQMLR